MGCAQSSDEESQPTNRPKYRTCTDTFWLAIYVLFWLFLVSFVLGEDCEIHIFRLTSKMFTNKYYTFIINTKVD